MSKRKPKRPVKKSDSNTYELTPLTKRDLDFVHLVSRDRHRYAIHGIYWNASRGHLVVTDGYYVLVLKLTDKFKDGPTVILDGEAMIKMHRRLKKYETLDSIRVTAETATLNTSEGASFDVPLLEGRYVEYDDFLSVSNKAPNKRTGFNPALMSRVLGVFPKYGGAVSTTMFEQQGHVFHMKCIEANGREWVGIVSGIG